MISDKKSKGKKDSLKDSQRYDLIINASARIFREKGYHHANMSDIAKAAGIQKGSLYHYIATKEDLLYEIVLSALKLYIRSLEEILEVNEKPDIIIRKAVIAHMKPIDISLDRVAVFNDERQNLSDAHRRELGKEVKRYQKLWLKLIDQGKKMRIFRDDIDSKIVLFSIYGMCNWALKWYRPKRNSKTSEVGDKFASIILDGLRK